MRFTLRNSFLTLFLVILLVLTYTSKASAAALTDRIAGYDRYQTAAAISQSGWPDGADTVILALGENYPDALSAGPLAQKYNAPILLTGTYSLNGDTAAELKRLKVKKVYIIGGYAVISSSVESQISSMGITTVRIAGQDRYETSLLIAKEVGVGKGIFVTNGLTFADALSIGPIAAALKMPILLVPPNDLTSIQKDFLSQNNIPLSYIVSGTDLSDKVVNQFPNVEIISGLDPYERNINLLNRFEGSLNLDTVYIATGEQFPDALAASALIQKNKNALILLQGDSLPYPALSFMRSKLISHLKFLGGTSVISDSTESKLSELPPQIASVEDVSESIQEKQKYDPPKTVTVTKTNGEKEEVPVTWSMTSVYSLQSGYYQFEGKIENYSGTVHLNLTVNPIVSKLNKITAEIIQDSYFNFPSTIEATMSDNTVISLPVTWKTNIVNLNKIGTYTFSGTVEGQTQKATLTLKVSADAKIDFPDLNLKTIVSRAAGKTTDSAIYKSDALNISILYANDSGITDLTGLEYFSNLQTLYLSDNSLTKTTSLSKLINLNHLEIRNSALKDLNSLKSLTSLTYLDIAANNIKDFSPLKGLTRLTSLFLSNNVPISPPQNYTPDYSPVRPYYKNLSARDFSL